MQGSGTTGLTLTGTDGRSSAALTVISGTHTVSAPILLDSNLDVSSSGSLTLAGNVSGLGMTLTLDGGGELILSGSNSYDGGTFVENGTLVVNNSSALLDGASLTVGAGGTFIFDPTITGGALDATSVRMATQINPVPEPGTLALLVCAALAAGFAASRRRNV